MNRLLSPATRAAFAAVNWPAVACFYALACAISFALWNVPNPTPWLPRFVIFTYGLGPVVAALITRRLFPQVNQTVTLLGTSPGRVGLFVGLPFVLGAAFGLINKRGLDPHLYGGLVVVSGVLYGLVEESGWRGFLHNALRSLPTGWRVGITALMWAGWHLTFLPDLSGIAGPDTPFWGVLAALVLGSWGLNAAAERTRSVLVVACLHEALNLVGSPVVLGVLVVGWVLMFWRWDGAWMPQQIRKLASILVLLCLSYTVVTAQSQSSSLPKQEIDVTAEQPDFPIFDKTFYDNQLFLLGESHGYQKPQQVDLALLKHFNKRIGVRYYIAEVDPTKAYYLNKYLQTGQDSLLDLVFRSWVAETAQWANRDFYQKIQAIRTYNQTLTAKKRIRFVGIDALQDRPLLAYQLRELTRLQAADSGSFRPDQPRLDSLVTYLTAIPLKPDSLAAQVAINWLAQMGNRPANYRNVPAQIMNELVASLTGLSYRKTIRRREPTLLANFRDAVVRLNLGREKLYGFWGLYHVLQTAPEKAGKPFATMVNESDLPMRGKVVSLVCRYVDSYMMVPTAFLPPFWQDKGKLYSRLDKFNDNGEMMKVGGIDSLVAQSRPNTVTLFKLTGTSMGQQPIKMTYSPFMPAEQRLTYDPNRPTTDYFQYVVLVRNSEMTEGF